MSIRISWQPSTDPFIASYDVEKSLSISGVWTLAVNIPHNLAGPNYDSANVEFFYIDVAGTAATYYRLTAIDDVGQRSSPSFPFRADSEAIAPYTAELVSEILVPAGNADALLALGYSHIEIWKSTDRGNSFQEVTSTAAGNASLHSLPPSTMYHLAGGYLVFTIDGIEKPKITFSATPGYYTASQVVAIINNTIPGVASVGSSGEVVVTSPTAGTVGSVVLTDSCYVEPLGFSAEEVYGTDVRIQIVSGVPIYFYYDPNPTPDARYKWRFSANGLKPKSSFSKQTSDVQSRLGIDPSNLAVGTALFTSVDGRIASTSILVTARSFQRTGTISIMGDQVKTFVTDEYGFVMVPLIRGAKVVVGLEGTAIVREITVPAVPVFDLLQAIADVQDQFTVQTTTPLLTRRSL